MRFLVTGEFFRPGPARKLVLFFLVMAGFYLVFQAAFDFFLWAAGGEGGWSPVAWHHWLSRPNMAPGWVEILDYVHIRLFLLSFLWLILGSLSLMVFARPAAAGRLIRAGYLTLGLWLLLWVIQPWLGRTIALGIPLWFITLVLYAGGLVLVTVLGLKIAAAGAKGPSLKGKAGYE